LREGDSGADIEILQRRLNRISTNFPGIPKISPPDGYFGSSTTDAVREFQKVFGLTEDGLVGRATWNQVSFVYNAVKRLSEVNSEGLTLADVTTDFTRELKEGDSGEGVLAVQYYLEYISRFVPTIQPTQLDGSYGPSTKNAVISFQKTYGLAQTGIVDRLTWDRMENVYYTYVNELDYASNPPVVLPYPGRLIAQGVEGNDVRVLQRYLNTIADVYTEIPKVSEDGIYGNATIAQVKKFREIFGIENESDRVGAATWNAIASVYEDITVGRMVNEGQYPGYRLS
jgi:peptidoglycan hydrolase-like protein with peptidoglycan-binding domain